MLFKAYGFVVSSDFDLQLPPAVGPADFVFRAGTIDPVQLFQTNIYRKGIRAKLGTDADAVVLHWEGVGTFKVTEQGQVTYQKRTQAEEVFRLFAVSEVLGLLLLQRGLFLLHGSAVSINGEATVFIGRPGAGKSSSAAAFARQNYAVLSDDLMAIWFDEHHKPFVLPGFSELKIWENTATRLGFDSRLLLPAFEGHNKFLYRQSETIFPTIPVPLRQIVFLQRPYSTQTEAVKVLESPMELLRHFPLPMRLMRGAALRRHFRDAIRLAGAVPLLKIPRPRNFELLKKWVNTFSSL